MEKEKEEQCWGHALFTAFVTETIRQAGRFLLRPMLEGCFTYRVYSVETMPFSTVSLLKG